MSEGQAVQLGVEAGASLPGNVPDDCHARIRQLVGYWVAIHPAVGLPGRQHFDPLEVPQLLPNIRLLDVIGKLPRFRIRLMGTQLREIFGEEQTGRWLDEVFTNLHGSLTHSELMRVVLCKKPRWRRGKPALDIEKNFLDMERVYLPFARDGTNVDMILTYLLFCDGKGNYR